MALARLSGMQAARPGWQVRLVALRSGGRVFDQLVESGMDVRSVGLESFSALPAGALKLYQIVREFRPDIVQTWLYHANVIGGVVARVAGVSRVVWGIRGTHIPQGSVSLTGAFVRLGAWLSRRVPALIVCNAEAGVVFHEQLGYAAERLRLVANGIDTSKFSPAEYSGISYREKWKVPQYSTVVGMVARFDPLKDFDIFLDAAAAVVRRCPQAYFVLVGAGLDAENTRLSRAIVDRNLQQRVMLAGEIRDIPAVMNAIDLFCLSSRGEGFPNVVIEAMACARPCVVTDAGDAGQIVGDTGWVVPTRNAAALAEALSFALSLSVDERHRKGENARNRVLQLYTLGAMESGFLRIYRELGCDV